MGDFTPMQTGPGNQTLEDLLNRYQTLINQLNLQLNLLENKDLKQQFMNAFLPDIANIGQRLERLQHNPLFSDEDYTHLNEAVTRLEEFFKYHFSSRPIEGAYLVSSAFWLYFPMSLNCFEAVLPNITTFVPQEQLDMFQDDLNRRLELVREFANEYVGAVESLKQAAIKNFNTREQGVYFPQDITKLAKLLDDAEQKRILFKNRDGNLQSVYFDLKEGGCTFQPAQNASAPSVTITKENNFLLIQTLDYADL